MDRNQLQDFVKNAVARLELGSKSPYEWVISTGKSGLSFGAMQNDVGNNSAARTAFTNIMNLQVSAGILTQAEADTIVNLAATAPKSLTPQQLTDVNAALAAHTDLVDQADAARTSVVMGYVDSALKAAQSNPNGSGELNPVAPDPEFLAELAEWGNRTGGLGQTNAFLSSATVISQANYETNFLQNQKQFQPTSSGGNGENFSTWQSRAADASSYGLTAAAPVAWTATGLE